MFHFPTFWPYRELKWYICSILFITKLRHPDLLIHTRKCKERKCEVDINFEYTFSNLKYELLSSHHSKTDETEPSFIEMLVFNELESVHLNKITLLHTVL